MFCVKCGKTIEDNTKFCRYCGSPVSNMPANNKPVEMETIVNTTVTYTVIKNKKNPIITLLEAAILVGLIVNIIAFFLPVAKVSIFGKDIYELKLIKFIEEKKDVMYYIAPLLASGLSLIAVLAGSYKTSEKGGSLALLIGGIDLVWGYNYEEWIEAHKWVKYLVKKGMGTTMYYACGWGIVICAVVCGVLKVISKLSNRKK